MNPKPCTLVGLCRALEFARLEVVSELRTGGTKSAGAQGADYDFADDDDDDDSIMIQW